MRCVILSVTHHRIQILMQVNCMSIICCWLQPSAWPYRTRTINVSVCQTCQLMKQEWAYGLGSWKSVVKSMYCISGPVRCVVDVDGCNLYFEIFPSMISLVNFHWWSLTPVGIVHRTIIILCFDPNPFHSEFVYRVLLGKYRASRLINFQIVSYKTLSLFPRVYFFALAQGTAPKETEP